MRLFRIDAAQLRRSVPRGREWWMLAIGAGAVLLVVGLASIISRPPTPLAADKKSAVSIPWLPETVRRWDDIIIEMGKKYDVDPEVIAILMTLESGGYSKALSPADATGLLQITPPTAKDIASKHLLQPREKYDLSDPRTNIEFGAAYLAYLRDEFGEPHQGPSWNATVELVAAGYNGGAGGAGKLYRGQGLTSDETVIYSRDAFNMWRERRAQQSPTFNRWLERGGQRLIDKAKGEQSGQ